MSLSPAEKASIDDFIAQRNEVIKECAKRGDKVSDIAITYDLSEAEVSRIIRGKRPYRFYKRISHMRPKAMEKIKETVANYRLLGWSVRAISQKLLVRPDDIKALIAEFKLPYGIRCSDCDAQIMLNRLWWVGNTKRCRKCARKALAAINTRRWNLKVANDPVLRARARARARASIARKQSKILG